MKSSEKRTDSLIAEFERSFQSKPSQLSCAPGRVNLIGEHTDYNDGFVLPIALKRDVRVVLRPRADRRVRLYSVEYNSWAEFELDSLSKQSDLYWGHYVQGVAWALAKEGYRLNGLDAVISGNVPKASGLSSSAALEVAMAGAFLAASNLRGQIPGPELAQIAQRAENEFVGVNCGIMDQFISVLGAADHALLIDCRSLAYELIPMPVDASIVIGNTKASRSLATSAYNERRSQCEEGVARLQKVLPSIRALRDVTGRQLMEHRDLLPPQIYQRCHHVVTENERVIQTVDAFRSGDLEKAGRLISASHVSLRDDYAVSSDALDVMVDTMLSVAGCYGARLTGAGFGGCAVALVQPGCEQAVADAIFAEYPKATNIWPEVYTTKAGDGARVIDLKNL